MKTDNYMYVFNKIDYTQYTPNKDKRDMTEAISNHFQGRM